MPPLIAAAAAPLLRPALSAQCGGRAYRPPPPAAAAGASAPAAQRRSAAARAAAAAASASNPASAAAAAPAQPRTSVPLKYVVTAAAARWFEDALADASAGDAKAAALLAQMYAAGYGCEADAEAAARWAERARVRGYRMGGVYCHL